MSDSPYCKTCHKAGKSYAEYTDHWTRDRPGPDGKIVCPIILNSICGYCKEKGHWIKYCPVINQQNKINNEYEDYNNLPIHNLNSWANKLKRTVSQSIPPNIHISLQSESYSFSPIRKTVNENIDVSVTSICDDEIIEFENVFRPPSPDYPPPPNY